MKLYTVIVIDSEYSEVYARKTYLSEKEAESHVNLLSDAIEELEDQCDMADSCLPCKDRVKEIFPESESTCIASSPIYVEFIKSEIDIPDKRATSLKLFIGWVRQLFL